jgi:SAM-dependent methyltransferase
MVEVSSAPAFAPPPRDARLAELLHEYPSSLFSERLYRSIELMERYTIDLAIDILTELQVFDQLDDWRSPPELCQSLNFKPQFVFAMGWLLQRLLETKCIEARLEGGAPATSSPINTHTYRMRNPVWNPELLALRSIGLEIDPANAPTLDLLDKAASLYPEVARGKQSGEQALFGAQGIPLWLNYFSNENSTYAINNWIAGVAACQRLGDKQNLRILELGAGASSGSEILLRCLDEKNLLQNLKRYLITEPNAFFLRRGQRELSKRYPDLPLEWRTLDMNQPWPEQGVFAGEFDLIYGVNVFHVARDLQSTIAQARETLAGNGWLIIGECVRPHSHQPIYVELIFQLLDSFTDVIIEPETRPNPGFLTTEQWQQSFNRAGFPNTEVSPDIHRIRDIYPHFFTAAICARP